MHGLNTHPNAEVVGVFDRNFERAKALAERWQIEGGAFSDVGELLNHCDAVAIASENIFHAELAVAAATAGKHVICEKPLVTNEDDANAMRAAFEGTGLVFATAFPCRFSPSFLRLKQIVATGEMGKLLAITATNRGRCPFDWFVQTELSGGGAMIDHVVHVADLLRSLLGEDPTFVQASIGNNLYGKDWDDTAMVTLQYPSGLFVTLDSSWSRPKNFRTWGDVTMSVVFENGRLELDMFDQVIERFSIDSDPSHVSDSFGSDLDEALIHNFVDAVLKGTPVCASLEDGLAASKIAIRAYDSVARTQPIALQTPTSEPYAKA
jgi:predicted dehydrogenase